MTDAPAANSKGNILLVDDDKFLVDMYSMKFTQAGFNVHACLSVDSGLDTLRGGFVPDVILFDLVMPKNDGFFLLETIRSEKLASNAILIALSNQGDEEAKQKVLSLGAARLIVKASMIPSEVLQAVQDEIQSHKK
jgi:DNA-binding response OmpR family regulator